MSRKAIILAFATVLTLSTVSAQISPGLQDKLDQRPDTERVDIIILTQPNANEQAKSAVRNANGNISHDFNIIDGVAVTIPKVAAENLADRDFVREIQPDYNVETRLSESADTVDAEEVWSQNVTGEGVDVAVLDTGIEDNTILNVEEQVDYTSEGKDDLNGHGTHVAGIIASPDEEYRGVAYGADLFDVKVLDQEGTGSTSDVISGLEWAVENNADVATLSLGAAVEECDGTSSISEAVDNTVEEGVTVTVAAGNNGPDSETITAPGCAENPITVGSSGNGEISDFSSRGLTADGRVKPDLVAPGEGITSLTNNDGDSPQFETLSGTSMATPHVAGAAALLLAEEDLSPSEVKNLTTYTAEDLGFDTNDQGSGRLDAYAAYQQVSQTQNQTENETGNEAPAVEVLGTQVNSLNESAEAELAINATDSDDETLNATFYFEGEQVSKQEGYGEITHTEANLSLNTTYNWSAEVTDGTNTTVTGTQSFSTDVDTGNENETEDDNQTGNRTGPELPPQASDTARKATSGFFNPTSLFYGFDVAFDRASVAVGLRTRESVMEERASEARAMAEKGNEEAAEKAVNKLRNTAGDSENATKEAEETLNRVLKGAPEEAKQGLRNALENVEKNRQQRKGQGQPESPRRSPAESEDRQPERGQNTENRTQRDAPETGNERAERNKTVQERKSENSQRPGNQEEQERTQEGQSQQDKGGKAGAGARAEAETGDNTSVEGEVNARAEIEGNSQNRDNDQKTGNPGNGGPNSDNTETENSGPPQAARGLVGNFFQAVLG